MARGLGVSGPPPRRRINRKKAPRAGGAPLQSVFTTSFERPDACVHNVAARASGVEKKSRCESFLRDLSVLAPCLCEKFLFATQVRVLRHVDR